MQYPMRKTERALDAAGIEKVLTENAYGVLSTVDADGQPYGVPLSYAYRDGTFYFHGAQVGHKLENLAANPRAGFCVVGQTELLPAKFSTKYESVIAFGTLRLLQGSEKTEALRAIIADLAPAYKAEGEKYIAAAAAETAAFCLEVESMTGKARR